MTPNETYDALERWDLLPTTEFTWRPFTDTAVYVKTVQQRLVYRLDLENMAVIIFKADPSTELSEHFLPLKTIPLTAEQITDLKHHNNPPVMQ